jgi:hypothetical protein
LFCLGSSGNLVADWLVSSGIVALILYAVAKQPAMALAASLLAGISWITVLAPLNVSAQVALPGWVRSRRLSIFGTVMFGA